jgi:uncharacterized protein
MAAPATRWALIAGLGLLLAGAAVGVSLTRAPQPAWWQAGPALPALTGRVVDDAALLPAARQAALATRLQAFESRTGHQLVVVTVPSLNGQSIADFGLRLGRTWGIGRKGSDDGILLIVAPTEGKVRIEVGYGLEQQLSDPACAAIIATDLLPSFKAGRFADGIDKGADAIMARLS